MTQPTVLERVRSAGPTIPDGVTVMVVARGLASMSGSYSLSYELDAQGFPHRSNVQESIAAALEEMAAEIRKKEDL